MKGQRINPEKINPMEINAMSSMMGMMGILQKIGKGKRKYSIKLEKNHKKFLARFMVDIKKEFEKTYANVPQMKGVLSFLDYIKTSCENKDLKEKFSQIDPRVEKLNKREFNQYEKAMNEASLFFNDETTSEEDKQKLMLAISEMFFMSKEINRKKYARKDKKKEENK